MRLQLDSDTQSSSSLLQRILFVGIFSILLVGAVVFVVEHPKLKETIASIDWFHIQQVSVEAQWPTTESEVRSWLPPLKGKSLLVLPVDELITLIREKPWVESVLVRKRYPDHIYIHVEPKKAVAIEVDKMDSYFLDHHGNKIEKVSQRFARFSDLPYVRYSNSTAEWQKDYPIQIFDQFSQRLGERYPISQIVMDDYPYFRIFLSQPRVEVTCHADTWQTQLPYLEKVLDNPPGQVSQINKISLVFPKKAVVRSRVSN